MGSSEIKKLAFIFVCIMIIGALGSIQWDQVLSGGASQSKIIVEIPESNPPADQNETEPESPGLLELSFNVTSVDWGELYPGENVSRGVLLTNTGDIKCQVYLTSQNWVPHFASFMIYLSWDQDGVVLDPGKKVEAELFLTVSQHCQNVTAFSFDVVFQLSETI